MGVWLPLALADITTLLLALVRAWSSNPGEVTISRRSELLDGWILPFTASALRAAEKAHEAKLARAQFAALQAKYGDPKRP